jgi:hypothetical protein
LARVRPTSSNRLNIPIEETPVRREPKLRTMIDALMDSDAPGICYDGMGHRADGINFALKYNSWGREHADKIIVRSVNTNLYLIHRDRI